jgi:hypothetical protein
VVEISQGSRTDVGGLRSSIESAFRKLHILPDRDAQLVVAVDAMAMLQGDDRRLPNAFRNTGRAAVQRELDKLAKLAGALNDQLSELHEPAIAALAAKGFLRGDLAAKLTQAIRAVDAADLSSIPMNSTDGKPPHLRARGVALQLAHHYQVLTSSTPTITVNAYADKSISDGPFVRLVADIFELLGVTSGHVSASRYAIEEVRRRMQTRNPI